MWDLRGKCEIVALAYGGGAGTLGGAVGSGMAVGGRREEGYECYCMASR